MFGWYRKLKSIYKLQQFRRLAQFGEGFQVYQHSACYADRPGLITIGKHCDIAGTLYSMDDGTIEIGDHTEIRENSFVGSKFLRCLAPLFPRFAVGLPHE